MIEGLREEVAFTYFFEDFQSTVPYIRCDGLSVVVSYKNKILEEIETYKIPFNIRDQRVLVAFDGNLPFGSLPKNSVQAAYYQLGFLEANGLSTRKHKDGEYGISPYKFSDDGRVAKVRLMRRFLLVPATSLIICRFRKNLAPWYAHVAVRKEDEQKVSVVWRNSSF
jgi:hypothetical protein